MTGALDRGRAGARARCGGRSGTAGSGAEQLDREEQDAAGLRANRKGPLLGVTELAPRAPCAVTPPLSRAHVAGSDSQPGAHVEPG